MVLRRLLSSLVVGGVAVVAILISRPAPQASVKHPVPPTLDDVALLHNPVNHIGFVKRGGSNFYTVFLVGNHRECLENRDFVVNRAANLPGELPYVENGTTDQNGEYVMKEPDPPTSNTYTVTVPEKIFIVSGHSSLVCPRVQTTYIGY